jgi:hypothetical protein
MRDLAAYRLNQADPPSGVGLGELSGGGCRRYGYLLHACSPFLDIDAPHDEPQAKGQLGNQGWYQNAREDHRFEGRGNKQGKAVREIGQACNLDQNAQEFGQVSRSGNQVSVKQARKAKENQTNVEDIPVQFD